MKFTIELEIDEEDYKKFKDVIKQDKNSTNEIFKLFIHKTVCENNIDWLYTSINGEFRTKSIKAKTAIQLFDEKGYNICHYNTSYASKNNGHDVYWINPDKRHLNEDWYIILNDYINKRLYLLNIPKNSISNLEMRNDRICNVSIRYNDINFLDVNSNICFGKYLIDMIEYESLIKKQYPKVLF